MEGKQLDLAIAMNETDVFHFDANKPSFNDLCLQNGFTYWYARDFMEMLGYSSYQNFNKAIQKAVQTCVSLGIDILDNFAPVKREIDSTLQPDYKLSRFACYLVAMNADTKKVEVARAQAFFAAIAETFSRYIEEADELERINIRDEITDHEKSLNHTAKAAGVDKYGLFQNAGYRGMYNMNLKDLKGLKGLGRESKRSLLDFMGKEELAANLFRVTQTESKLRNDGVKGQSNAEYTAEQVGLKVRNTMIEISGTRPESLELTGDIKKVKSAIKSSQKDFKKIDQ